MLSQGFFEQFTRFTNMQFKCKVAYSLCFWFYGTIFTLDNGSQLTIMVLHLQSVTWLIEKQIVPTLHEVVHNHIKS